MPWISDTTLIMLTFLVFMTIPATMIMVALDIWPFEIEYETPDNPATE